jgi:hypothetical protein
MGFVGTQNSNFVGTHKKYPWQQAMGFCTIHWMTVGGREAGREAGFGGNNKNFSSLHRCLPLNQRQNPASLCQKNTLIERQERRNFSTMPLVILVLHPNPCIALSAKSYDASSMSLQVRFEERKKWTQGRGPMAFAVSRRAEQLRLRTQQRIIATAEDSVLRTEMANLESQEEDAPNVSSPSSR